MEAKKSEKADLTNKTGLFFSIGLTFTLIVAERSFEHRTYEEKLDLLQGARTNVMEEMLEVPPTEQPPPPAPVIQQPQIVEVPDEQEIKEDLNIKFDVEVTEDTKVEAVTVVEEVKEEVDEIFTVVEETATPKGGMSAFYKMVSDKMKYPAQARRMGVEGKVFVQFVIGKDGAISDVKVIKGIGAGCDEEAIRVVQSSPSWNPGKQRGKAVKQRYTLPIIFKLG
ncbi:MAG: TonB family protein [Chryseotalea sp. WA131a]|jgi:protein TonB|nr:MAG: TonB family protein [Chryseotalea sp. WA131a]